MLVRKWHIFSSSSFIQETKSHVSESNADCGNILEPSRAFLISSRWCWFEWAHEFGWYRPDQIVRQQNVCENKPLKNWSKRKLLLPTCASKKKTTCSNLTTPDMLLWHQNGYWTTSEVEHCCCQLDKTCQLVRRIRQSQSQETHRRTPFGLEYFHCSLRRARRETRRGHGNKT